VKHNLELFDIQILSRLGLSQELLRICRLGLLLSGFRFDPFENLLARYVDWLELLSRRFVFRVNEKLITIGGIVIVFDL
jgi:hypothetical protein